MEFHKTQISLLMMQTRLICTFIACIYSKTCVKRPLSKRPKTVITWCRSEVVQNASIGAFCTTFDLHQASFYLIPEKSFYLQFRVKGSVCVCVCMYVFSSLVPHTCPLRMVNFHSKGNLRSVWMCTEWVASFPEIKHPFSRTSSLAL